MTTINDQDQLLDDLLPRSTQRLSSMFTSSVNVTNGDSGLNKVDQDSEEVKNKDQVELENGNDLEGEIDQAPSVQSPKPLETIGLVEDKKEKVIEAKVEPVVKKDYVQREYPQKEEEVYNLHWLWSWSSNLSLEQVTESDAVDVAKIAIKRHTRQHFVWTQIKGLLIEAIKTAEEERHVVLNLETAKWELANAENEAKWLKSVAISSEKKYEQIQQDIDDIQIELENERCWFDIPKIYILILNSNSIKLKEELKELKGTAAEMSSETGEAAVQKLQEEIKFCKSILQCLVYRDRPKEVVIVKCFHLFCNHCIQKNLEIWHRKFPACGTPFGQNDIRLVKI
ncbi:hypothetical protein UlMin_018710 [Ulmus minor]